MKRSTNPISTEIDHAQLLEIIQGLTEDIQNLIELDVSVGSMSELAKEFHIPRVKVIGSKRQLNSLSFELDFENDGENGGAEVIVIKASSLDEAIDLAEDYIGAFSLTDMATKKCTYLS